MELKPFLPFPAFAVIYAMSLTNLRILMDSLFFLKHFLQYKGATAKNPHVNGVHQYYQTKQIFLALKENIPFRGYIFRG